MAGAPRSYDQTVDRKAETPAEPTVQAESTEAPVAVPERPPIPRARPTPAAVPSKTADEKRGAADGEDRSAQAASKGKRQKEAGTAAEDNYRGDVFRKLGSVNRTLPPSLQLAARNNAVVTFVIGKKGNINELRILETSGSAAFDQAALGIVRKAAPLPSDSTTGSKRKFGVRDRNRPILNVRRTNAAAANHQHPHERNRNVHRNEPLQGADRLGERLRSRLEEPRFQPC
ncbi:TonB family protein [Mesorhizobium sp.]|uniref:energy transducer TonB n=1 Tax=Mesorhizobium sp. TaxID=1871066 RepID=UPI00341A63E5